MPIPSTRRPGARLAAACTAAAALLAPLAAAPSAGAATTAPGSTPAATTAGAAAVPTVPALKVLTYNVFLMSKNLYPNWGQDHRAKAIPAAGFFQGQDVVVLQEAFDNAASDQLIAQASAAYPYHTPVVGRSTSGWDATSGSYSSSTPEDGGVTLLSKWPVLRKEQYVFKDACGADWWSNKGFVYAVLDVNGLRTHVIGTHLQSTDTGCSAGEPAAVRAAQLKTMKAFVDAKNIPAAEPVVLAGDLNIDSHGTEYPSLLANAGVAPADTRTGWADSFDTADNSIAAYRYPGEPNEDLDYVLYRADHARPATYGNTVVRFHSSPWTVSSWGKNYTYTDLSDHYPVTAG
ncbi:sphingomyelin phosphodiesterase [Streptomyces sp. BE20]|uniref:sphingomyelin phosphodiesterase n=1 Tax=unclassified Streptomyces TaxID=2593676 RepID=UPI002E77E9E1|nr:MULTISPECIES: sphingomyelin phosphodiesterase [unclassified Streptomyces]MED7952618.1 sphingomyelin phosphodiesterase [Streptomyces sp. BE303]MEE1824244.1 sphingomyelin phosphodiesterase [Streptomyces sp. BE20]